MRSRISVWLSIIFLIGFFTVKYASGRFVAGGAPISPWAEANQGLLSLLALVTALGFALWENWRANNADDRRRREFLRLLVELIDAVLSEGASVKQALADGVPSNTIAPDFNSAKQRAMETLLVVRPGMPMDATLAIAVAKFRHDLGSSWDWSIPQGPRDMSLQSHIDEMARHRKVFLDLRRAAA